MVKTLTKLQTQQTRYWNSQVPKETACKEPKNKRVQIHYWKILTLCLHDFCFFYVPDFFNPPEIPDKKGVDNIDDDIQEILELDFEVEKLLREQTRFY